MNRKLKIFCGAGIFGLFLIFTIIVPQVVLACCSNADCGSNQTCNGVIQPCPVNGNQGREGSCAVADCATGGAEYQCPTGYHCTGGNCMPDNSSSTPFPGGGQCVPGCGAGYYCCGGSCSESPCSGGGGGGGGCGTGTRSLACDLTSDTTSCPDMTYKESCGYGTIDITYQLTIGRRG